MSVREDSSHSCTLFEHPTRPAGSPSLPPLRSGWVGSATSGSSGQWCFGYRPLRSFRTSKYVVRQNPARSRVTCTGRPAGESRCSVTGTAPPPTRGCLSQAEQLLEPDGQHRLPGIPVVHRYPGAARHHQMGRGQAVQRGALLPGQQVEERAADSRLRSSSSFVSRSTRGPATARAHASGPHRTHRASPDRGFG